ncbi:hypothetical protein NQ318_014564 [Aromia moschata]|uniref:Uncharacterized protein n=1 Tax=Aromia moschata TaxID=1265417 RepID=A0AAV8XYT3_9CUCU|nr:hypothetical protein NQ318_014564 [Aromia moschata]
MRIQRFQMNLGTKKKLRAETEYITLNIQVIQTTRQRRESLYATILLLLSVLQVLLGVFCILFFVKGNEELGEQIRGSFVYSFKNYKSDPRFVDTVQQTLQCCGIRSASDWSNNTLPWSCCEHRDYHPKQCTADSTFLFGQGCVEASTSFILFWEPIFGYSSVGFGTLEVILKHLY